MTAILDMKSAVVTLTNTVIDKSLLRDLCDALNRSDAVTQLDLSGNTFLSSVAASGSNNTALAAVSSGSDEAMDALAELLSNKPRIVHINLRRSSVSDIGVSVLCRGLSRFGSCKSLDLSSNAVTDIGLAELAKFVEASTELETLNLMDTPVSLRGTLTFADALVKNESLTQLLLPHVLGHRVLSEVERLMRRNRMRRAHTDERRAQRRVERSAEAAREGRVAEQWRSTQPMYVPPPPASGFSIEQWSDPSLAPVLLHLEVLSKKQQRLAQQEKHRSATWDLVGSSDDGPLSRVASRVPPLPVAGRRAAAGSVGGASTTSRERRGWLDTRDALAKASSNAKAPASSQARVCW